VDGEREILPGVSVVPTGGHSKGHQAILVRGGGGGGRTLAFFGDLLMRPWAANPRWVTSFDDFPLDSVARKGELFGQAADEGWIVVLSHEREQPIGRLVRDRDRFRYEADPAGSPRWRRPRLPRRPFSRLTRSRRQAE
jgi:glyoxylase-like metal-dependent hydrolase (beta-lactamase superfamily II)